MVLKMILSVFACTSGMLASLMLTCAADDASDTSDCAVVMLDADTSSFWRTATNNVVTIPVDYPLPCANSAKLTVEGNGYSRTIENIPEGDYELELPAATSPGTENVYDLTLVFSDGTRRKCSIAVIEGAGLGDSGSGRLLLPQNAGMWKKVDQRAVMPIAFGALSLAIDGEIIENPLGGAQGWLAFGPLAAGIGATAAITFESGEEQSADLLGRSNAIQIRVK